MAIQDSLINLVPTDKKPVTSFLGVLKRLLPFGQIWGFSISPVSRSEAIIQDTINTGTDPVIQDTINTGTNPVIQDAILAPGAESNVQSSTLFGAMLSAFASELYRFQDRMYDLSREWIPGLSVELLEEHEKQAGLPNECTIDYETIPIAERQAYAHAQMFTDHTAGLSESYLTDYAQVVGYEIEIDQEAEVESPFIVAPVGVDAFDLSSRIGDRLNASGQWGSIIIKIVGGDTSPDPLARFQCQVEKLKGAHVEIIWEVV